MKNTMASLRDRDGNLVFDELDMNVSDLRSCALMFDMLSKRFDESSLDLDVFFHCFHDLSCLVGQRVDEISFNYRLLHDFVLEGIPIDIMNSAGRGA